MSYQNRRLERLLQLVDGRDSDFNSSDDIARDMALREFCGDSVDVQKKRRVTTL